MKEKNQKLPLHILRFGRTQYGVRAENQQDLEASILARACYYCGANGLDQVGTPFARLLDGEVVYGVVRKEGSDIKLRWLACRP